MDILGLIIRNYVNCVTLTAQQGSTSAVASSDALRFLDFIALASRPSRQELMDDLEIFQLASTDASLTRFRLGPRRHRLISAHDDEPMPAVVASTPRERGACRQLLNFPPNAGERP